MKITRDYFGAECAWPEVLAGLKDIDDDEVLVSRLVKYNEHAFDDEPVDLNKCIALLNRLDSILSGVVNRGKNFLYLSESPELSPLASSPVILTKDIENAKIVLRFSSYLLFEAINKDVYHSTELLLIFLRSYDDELALLAMDTLNSLDLPTPSNKTIDISRSRSQSSQAINICPPLFDIVESNHWSSHISAKNLLSTSFKSVDLFKNIVLDINGKPKYKPPDANAADSDNDYSSESPISSFIINDIISDNRGIKDIIDDAGISYDFKFTLMWKIRIQRLLSRGRDGRILALIVQYQAILVLLTSHSDPSALAHFFQDKVDLLHDFIYFVRSGPGSVDYDKDRSDNNEIPLKLRVTACNCLNAIISARNSASISVLGRFSWVLNDLGINREHFMGLVPCLLRSSSSFLVSLLQVSPASTIQLDDSINSQGLGNDERVRWIESIYSLTSALISFTSALPILVDNGMISSLLPILKCKVDSTKSIQIIQLMTGVIQLLDSAIAHHNQALTIFKEQNGPEILIESLHSILTQLNLQGDIIFKGLILEEGVAKSDSTETDKNERKVRQSRSSKKPKTTGESEDINMDLQMDGGEPPVIIPMAVKVYINQLLSVMSSYIHDSRQDGGDNNLPQLIKGANLTECLHILLRNSTHMTPIVMCACFHLLTAMINDDPTPPSILTHLFSNGIVYLSISILPKYHIHRKLSLLAHPELLMNICSLISSISLTQDAVKLVTQLNPFSYMFNIFHSDELYTAIALNNISGNYSDFPSSLGSSLEELIRHNEVMMPYIVAGIISEMKGISLLIGEYIANNSTHSGPNTHLRVFAYWQSLLVCLEPIFTRKQSVDFFVAENGIQLLLDMLYDSLSYPNKYILISLCSAVNPSTYSIGHYPLTSAIAQTLSKICESSSKSFNNLVLDRIFLVFDSLELSYTKYKALHNIPSETSGMETKSVIAGKKRGSKKNDASKLKEENVSFNGLLSSVSRDQVYDVLEENVSLTPHLEALSSLLRDFVNVGYLLDALSTTLQPLNNRQLNHAQLKSIVDDFNCEKYSNALKRITGLYIAVANEISASKNSPMSLDNNKKVNLIYKLLIINQDGVVIRETIEDGSSKVGKFEHGLIVDAYERVYAGSTIVKYRTKSGWISIMRSQSAIDQQVEIVGIKKNILNEYVLGDDNKEISLSAKLARERICNVSLQLGAFNALYHVHIATKRLMCSISKLFIPQLDSIGSSKAYVPKPSMLYIDTVNKLLTDLVPSLDYPKLLQWCKPVQGDPIVPVELDIPSMADFNNQKAFTTIQLVEFCFSLFFDERRSKIDSNVLMMHYVCNPGADGVSLFEKIIMSTVSLFLCALDDVGNVDESSFVSDINVEKRLRSERKMVAISTMDSIVELWRYLFLYYFSTNNEKNDRAIMYHADETHDYNPFSTKRCLCVKLCYILSRLWLHSGIRKLPQTIIRSILDVIYQTSNSLMYLQVCPTHLPAPTRSAGDLNRMNLPLTSIQYTRNRTTLPQPLRQDFQPSEEVVSLLVDMGFDRNGIIQAAQLYRSNDIETLSSHLCEFPYYTGPSAGGSSSNPNPAQNVTASDVDVDTNVTESIDLMAPRRNSSSSNAASSSAWEPNVIPLKNDIILPVSNKKLHAQLAEERSAVRSTLALFSKTLNFIYIPLIQGCSEDSTQNISYIHWDTDLVTSGKASKDLTTVIILNHVISHLQKLDANISENSIKILILSWLYQAALNELEALLGSPSVDSTHNRPLYALLHAIALLLSNNSSLKQIPQRGRSDSCNSDFMYLLFTMDTRFNLLYPKLINLLWNYFGDDSNIAMNMKLAEINWVIPALLVLDIVNQPFGIDKDSLRHSLSEFQEHYGSEEAVVSFYMPEYSSSNHSGERILSKEFSELITNRFLVKPVTAPSPQVVSGSSSADKGSRKRKLAEVQAEGEVNNASASNKTLYDEGLTSSQRISCAKVILKVFDVVSSKFDLLSPEVAICEQLSQSSLQLMSQLAKDCGVRNLLLSKKIGEMIVNKVVSYSGIQATMFTLIQRLLEDEKQLLQTMETVIKHVYLRLTKDDLNSNAPRRKVGSHSKSATTLKSMVELLTPLMYRDQQLFLLAFTNTMTVTRNDRKEVIVKMKQTMNSKNSDDVQQLPDHVNSSSKGPSSSFAASINALATPARTDIVGSRKSGSTSQALKRSRQSNQSSSVDLDNSNVVPGLLEPIALMRSHSFPRSTIKSADKSKISDMLLPSPMYAQQPSFSQQIIDELLQTIIGQWTRIQCLDLAGEIRADCVDMLKAYPDCNISLSGLLCILADLVSSLHGIATIVHKYRIRIKRGENDHDIVNSIIPCALPIKHALSGTQMSSDSFLTFLVHSLMLSEVVPESKVKSDNDHRVKKIKHIAGSTIKDSAIYLFSALVNKQGDGRRRALEELLLVFRSNSALDTPSHLNVCLSAAVTITSLLNPPKIWYDRDIFEVQSKDILQMLTTLRAHTYMSYAICTMKSDLHSLSNKAAIEMAVPLEIIIRKGLPLVAEQQLNKLSSTQVTSSALTETAKKVTINDTRKQSSGGNASLAQWSTPITPNLEAMGVSSHMFPRPRGDTGNSVNLEDQQIVSIENNNDILLPSDTQRSQDVVTEDDESIDSNDGDDDDDDDDLDDDDDDDDDDVDDDDDDDDDDGGIILGQPMDNSHFQVVAHLNLGDNDETIDHDDDDDDDEDDDDDDDDIVVDMSHDHGDDDEDDIDEDDIDEDDEDDEAHDMDDEDDSAWVADDSFVTMQDDDDENIENDDGDEEDMDMAEFGAFEYSRDEHSHDGNDLMHEDADDDEIEELVDLNDDGADDDDDDEGGDDADDDGNDEFFDPEPHIRNLSRALVARPSRQQVMTLENGMEHEDHTGHEIHVQIRGTHRFGEGADPHMLPIGIGEILSNIGIELGNRNLVRRRGGADGETFMATMGGNGAFTVTHASPGNRWLAGRGHARGRDNDVNLSHPAIHPLLSIRDNRRASFYAGRSRLLGRGSNFIMVGGLPTSSSFREGIYCGTSIGGENRRRTSVRRRVCGAIVSDRRWGTDIGESQLNYVNRINVLSTNLEESLIVGIENDASQTRMHRRIIGTDSGNAAHESKEEDMLQESKEEDMLQESKEDDMLEESSEEDISEVVDRPPLPIQLLDLSSMRPPCPDGYDPEIWNELPLELQLEALSSMETERIASPNDNQDLPIQDDVAIPREAEISPVTLEERPPVGHIDLTVLDSASSRETGIDNKEFDKLRTTVVMVDDRKSKDLPYGKRLVLRLFSSLVTTNRIRCPRPLLRLLATICRYKESRRIIVSALIAAMSNDGSTLVKQLCLLPTETNSPISSGVSPMRPSSSSNANLMTPRSEELANIVNAAVDSELKELQFKASELMLTSSALRRLIGAFLYLMRKTDKLVWYDILSRDHSVKSKWLFGQLISLLSHQAVFTSQNLDAILHAIEEVCEPLQQLTIDEANKLAQVSCNADIGASSTSVGSVESSTPIVAATPNLAVTNDDIHVEKGGEIRLAMPFPVLNEEEAKILAVVAGSETYSLSVKKRFLKVLKPLSLCDQNYNKILHALSMVGNQLAAAAQCEVNLIHSMLSKVLQVQGDALVAMTLPALSVPSSVSELRLSHILNLMTQIRKDTSETDTKHETIFSEVVSSYIRKIHFSTLWDNLCECLDLVRELEGIIDPVVETKDNGMSSSFMNASSSTIHDLDMNVSHDAINVSTMSSTGNMSTMMDGNHISVSALTMRFMPLIECFLTVCGATILLPASSIKVDEKEMDIAPNDHDLTKEIPMNRQASVPGARFRNHSSYMQMQMELEDSDASKRLLTFVESNRVLLNMLLRHKVHLLDSSFSLLALVPRCRHLLHFDVKRAFFKSKIKKLRNTNHNARNHSLRLEVRRQFVFEDSFNKLRYKSADDLRKRLAVSFVGEEGLDAGGVTREWYTVLAREIFNPNYALFTCTTDNITFQPNGKSDVNPDHLDYFKFVGRIIGKAICDGQLLDAHFTRSFYKHILGLSVNYHDLEAIEPEYYKSLKQLLEWPLEELGLDLTFSVESNDFGQLRVVDLIPDGQNIPVTDDNKSQYIQLIAQNRTTTAIRAQIDHFLEGFHELVPPELISIFDAQELELLISGLPYIDIDDLRANTEYHNYREQVNISLVYLLLTFSYSLSFQDNVISWFWDILRNFSREEKASFVQFITGTSKVPLEGFSNLQGMGGVQRFSIHKAYGDDGKLPTAHTCYNQLDLPCYNTYDELKEKLLMAVKEGQFGFGFV